MEKYRRVERDSEEPEENEIRVPGKRDVSLSVKRAVAVLQVSLGSERV